MKKIIACAVFVLFAALGIGFAIFLAEVDLVMFWISVIETIMTILSLILYLNHKLSIFSVIVYFITFVLWIWITLMLLFVIYAYTVVALGYEWFPAQD